MGWCGSDIGGRAGPGGRECLPMCTQATGDKGLGHDEAQSLSPTGISAESLEAQFFSEGQLCSAHQPPPSPSRHGQQGWELQENPTTPEGRAAYGYCPNPPFLSHSELMVIFPRPQQCWQRAQRSLVNMLRWCSQKRTGAQKWLAPSTSPRTQAGQEPCLQYQHLVPKQ